jgi:FdhE protein
MTTSAIPIQVSGEPPRIIVPDVKTVFATRARRFEQLAEGHALGDWLLFLAAVTQAQHEALQALPAPSLPDAATLAQLRAHNMPPLPAQSWPRDGAWRAALQSICRQIAPTAPAVARAELDRLQALADDELEALANRVLHTELYGDDAALLPYVAAALQVLWTGAAARLGDQLAALDVPGVCPCCGFLPVASVVRRAGEVANLRYLHCALCNTEWNLVRVKCASCDSTAGIGYRKLESTDGTPPPLPPEAVRAETCESCKSYLKIVYQEQGGVDPVADDLATLALDILVDEAGYARSGPNLLLMPG